MAEYKTNITKEELQKLEPETLPIGVVVLSHTSSIEQVEEACNRLKEGNKVLGFDTETKPSFRKGKSYKVSLLQLSSPDFVVLFRLLPSWDKKLLEPLQKILKSKRIAKVGVAIGDDAKGLWADHQLITNRMVDLRTLAKGAGVEVLSLTRLYAVLYNKRISKGQRLSDWEREELTEGQVDYAALDAYAGLRIFEGFKKVLNRSMYFNLDVQQPKKRVLKKKDSKQSKQ
ncbi:3'-5' exonuclease [Porphyromonas levii]|uniref:3'-5' exonuclease domain-containing protein 2 n=1 Tax=Porphyromonas levii TaxID=28114 RepID=A0A4Y8WR69_9PORP|nr:3'-5' exonuclease [Porphyromonas levii]MBR8729027.1 Ribonuclease D [Porphyromonas levii]MBR8731767.1 Ribonuclease D [Porphyromonas levii]MBR8759701.1 Ribonuclease D [Porphyromonas levii]MBR8763068.1 Ribonuclease D [Porphyromonas levii]MBR8801669.1 Ribonuclease D [Porphyromonas levii]